MRQVFTSLRVETVEGVAKLLEDAGIEVYIANGRSYHSKRGSQFSYAEPMTVKQQPSVWVKRAEDQPRARELLRGAGLMSSTRSEAGDALVFASDRTAGTPARPRSWAWRIRVGLLIALAVASLVTLMRYRGAQEVAAPQTVPPAAVQPVAEPQPAQDEEETVRVRIPNQNENPSN
jgi:hypothetical protein